jgi:AcrR family transcriptional regulator
LLDVGAEIVAELGADSLTMEGVALRAGVSKALPYQHFQDAEDLLVALATREAGIIAERTSSAFSADEPLEAGLRRSLGAYFDMVEERGTLLGAIFQYRFSPPRQQEVDKIWAATAAFFAHRFAAEFGMSMRVCQAAAFTLLAAVVGAQQVWVGGLVSRQESEDLLVHMMVDGLAGVARAGSAEAESGRTGGNGRTKVGAKRS